jgi:hypothetical protein
MRTLKLLLPVVLVVCVSVVQADTILVPSQQPTIQAGIDAASDGDTVMVADGTYTGDGNRDIDFLGKAIVVMSENGPENCIIDCEEGGRGFIFQSGEDSTSIVQGFTITNGYCAVGGGIYCAYSSPTVTNCTFSGNSADFGGGMRNYGGSPTVANCMFSGNVAYQFGGGMYNNFGSSPTVSNCTFSGNSAQMGGGMYNYSSSPTVTNCTFSQNSAVYDGGGMQNYTGSPTVANCTFTGNVVYIKGGGMYNSFGSSPTVSNCTFSQNWADFGGGMCNSGGSPTFANCMFSGNSADDGGGMYNFDSSPTVTNSILWSDLPDEIFVDGGNPIVKYSNVQGGWPGEGNIDEDPLFVSFHGFDFLLRKGSPCIDAGDPDIEDGRSWPIWYNNGLQSDMGAYGGPGNVGWLQ